MKINLEKAKNLTKKVGGKALMTLAAGSELIQPVNELQKSIENNEDTSTMNLIIFIAGAVIELYYRIQKQNAKNAQNED